jgi:uncharacterized protein (TIGR02145 family)
MNTGAINKAAILAGQILIFLHLSLNAQELKDFDGNDYKSVKYGMQEWTASNLNVAHFRNGDVIAEAKTPEEWVNAAATGTPAWCHYENNAENGKIYGKLYNWFAINDPRGLAPDGWHISANSDWKTLVKNLMGVDVTGGKLKSKAGWKSGKGSDKIGFAAMPGGYRNSEGKFRDLQTVSQWWSNTVPVDVKPSQKIYSFKISDLSSEVKYIEVDKGMGLSVRCEKD